MTDKPKFELHGDPNWQPPENAIGYTFEIASPTGSDFYFLLDNGKREMLRISKDGFFVEGRPVPIDDIEEHDKEVYRAFKKFVDGVK